MIVEFGCADIGVAEPGLDLGDVGIVLQGIGRGAGAQAMHPEAGNSDSGALGVLADQGIDSFRGNSASGLRPAQWAKQRRVVVQVMP